MGLLLVAGPGCGGMLAQMTGGADPATVERLEAEVARYEKLRPDTGALAKGDVSAYRKAMKQGSDLMRLIAADLDGSDEERLIERVRAARERYIVAAADAAGPNDPNVGFWVTLTVTDGRFSYDDVNPGIMKRARRHARARGSFRQKEFERHGSYRADGRGGNCVFSARPFGRPGTKNKGVAYWFEGKSVDLHVRCFSEDDLRRLAGDGGKLEVRLYVNATNIWTVPVGAVRDMERGLRHADARFRIPQPPFGDDDDFLVIKGELVHWWITGYEYRGNKKVPTWGSRTVATSTFLWERNPGGLVAARR